MPRKDERVQVRFGDFLAALPVAVKGHEWRSDLLHDEKPAGWVLAESQDFLSGAYRVTGPLAARTTRRLHHRFAKIAEAPDEEMFKRMAVDFANEHGLLNATTFSTVPPLGWLPVEGDTLATWHAETAQFARLIRWWEIGRDEDQERARRLVTWHHRTDPGWVSIRSGAGDRHVVHTINEPGRIAAWRSHEGFNYAAALRHAVVQHVDGSLRGHASVQIAGDARGYWFMPDSLLAALYLLFGREMLGDSGPGDEPAACPACGAAFNRRHGRQRYCSPKCTKRAWEQRHPGKLHTHGERKEGTHGKPARSR